MADDEWQGDFDEHGRFAKGNQLTVKHGGRAALERIREGRPFDGLAREIYEQVISELGVNLDTLTGIDRVRLQRAAAFETAARLFDGAAQSAAAQGDVQAWERYQQRGGWIGGKAFAALTDLRSVTGLGTDVVIDALAAARAAREGEK